MCGCSRIALNTLEIQARGFYEKQGYETAATLDCDPPGVTRYHEAVVLTKKDIILKAFKEAGGNYVETARLLDVHPNYLHRLIRNMNLKGLLKKQEPLP